MKRKKIILICGLLFLILLISTTFFVINQTKNYIYTEKECTDLESIVGLSNIQVLDTDLEKHTKTVLLSGQKGETCVYAVVTFEQSVLNQNWKVLALRLVEEHELVGGLRLCDERNIYEFNSFFSNYQYWPTIYKLEDPIVKSIAERAVGVLAVSGILSLILLMGCLKLLKHVLNKRAD